VPAGPFYLQDLETKAWKEVDLPTYRIDVYETTREAYAVYASMSGLHGDTPQSLGRVVLPRAQARLPEVTLSPVMVDRYCQFRGMRTQTANQWRKAARGGLWLDAARTVPNPAPKRPTPWGTRDRGPANVLTDPTQAVRLLPVGSFPLDRGPSGALDLFGSGLELTRDRIGELRIAVGASVGFVTPDAQFVIDEFNQRLEFSRPQDGIARCVEE
jgi:formylglycine-generating enzyme required for sulfatase activity